MASDADSFLARTTHELSDAPTAPRSERGDRSEISDRGERDHRDYRDRRDRYDRSHRDSRDHSDRDHRDSRDPSRSSRSHGGNSRDRFRERPHDRYRSGSDRGDRRLRDSEYSHSSSHSSRRSRSPRGSRSRSHRDKTPDLENIVPIDQRPRRKGLFDVKPAGYENVTSEMAKMSGVFPLPGAPRPVNYSKLQGLANQLPVSGASDGFQMRNNFNRNNSANYNNNPSELLNNNSNGGFINLNNTVTITALNASNSRTAKRVIVTGFVPSDIAQEEVASFFSEYLSHIELDNPIEAGQALIVKAHINNKLDSIVVEFISSEIATIMVALDGIKLGYGDSGPSLSISRPEDYITPEDPETHEVTEGEVSSVIPDSSTKISVSNIPSFLGKDHILDLLTAFGPLSGFKLLQDTDGLSLGVAFCQFQDASVTDTVCEGLNGMELAENSLVVRRASVGTITQSASITAGNIFGIASRANQAVDEAKSSRVLLLLNMVTPEELIDEDDYLDIRDDVEDECAKFGRVMVVKIPRPESDMARASKGGTKDLKDVSSVGKIFVKFETKEACEAAAKALAGRKFSDRTVLTTFYSEQSFDLDAF
ncbi:hypothetical protein NADFUDRAFT_52716 [Nadsonia fulvescens var. elongata DSM 6958]|uniref:RRM domain-containing protein n=1 Tax=Nadsonia fulvescens var. elongata DSM 6958 TaxID=857566 RepID=A0A1E3PHP5_9ASCO|nr:hypothetical protein NADFUDRAFT_52716 [Nadsonia fulvescens var. elongata DSM 6958]